MISKFTMHTNAATQHYRRAACIHSHQQLPQNHSLYFQQQPGPPSRERSLCVCSSSNQDQAETPAYEGRVSRALTAIGLSGSLAVSGAALCGINLFSMFHWERLQDLQLALELNSVLFVLEALLYVPPYSVPASLLQQQRGVLDMQAISSCSAWDPRSWQLMAAMKGTALRRRDPEDVPLPITAGLLVAREGSKELLQRGFFLTAFAGWLTDRLYEADVGGLEGLVTLPGRVLVLPVPELALWVAAAAATVLFSPLATLHAQESADGVSGTMLLQTPEWAAMAAVGGPSEAAASLPYTPGSAAADKETAAAAAEETAAAAATAAAAEEEEYDEPVDREVLEYRLVKVTDICLDSAAAQLGYRITLATELGRIMLANVAFVVTQQNLAATLTAKVLAAALTVLYARGLWQQQGPPQLGQQVGQ